MTLKEKYATLYQHRSCQQGVHMVENSLYEMFLN